MEKPSDGRYPKNRKLKVQNASHAPRDKVDLARVTGAWLAWPAAPQTASLQAQRKPYECHFAGVRVAVPISDEDNSEHGWVCWVYDGR